MSVGEEQWHKDRKRWRTRDPNEKKIWSLPTGLLLGRKVYPTKHQLNKAIWFRLRCLRNQPCQNWNVHELLIQKSLVCQALGRVGKQLATELACQWAIHQIDSWYDIPLPFVDVLLHDTFENTAETINKWSNDLRILLIKNDLAEVMTRIDEMCFHLRLAAGIAVK